ncbi:LOW QUALITY PROTEIN: protein fem-1 homolog CG6966 [Drosophila nasuta]|uniref:LOW QUALITY PROTEIN: protein fem-1 homolog CG6966 n=1 Tax=Drosophila nasuta TaxID=42062 RepID=UPI00295EAD2B|nr:LOW QUALITY PROTEIN: protein fem-1 homolog CG6966 [Drosophila nasuta]
MDHKFIVFNAARDNNLPQLKAALYNKSAPEMATLISSKVNGATPLVIACRNGHYDIVEYLLTKCRANVEQVGSISFDGEPIEDAPPLWCAAAAGHLGIVKMLVRRSANVNSTTRTNSTPLRAACFDGHYEIVKYLVHHGADFEVANRHGHTCLMIACYKGHYRIAQYLLSLNADVNRCSIKGNTALHDSAESGSLQILQLLLKHGATMDVDYYGMTPLLAASVTGHMPIVEHLITLPCVSRVARIDALELLGATYVDKKRDMAVALTLWRRALEERAQTPRIYKKLQEPVPAYELVTEVTTIEELEELVLDPDEMRMQALVIRQRILGPTHPDTSYYIRFRGAHYADAGRFDRCIELWSYALTMQQKILQPLSPMTQSSLLSFAELFSFMLVEAGRLLPRGRIVPPIEADGMLTIFHKAVLEVERGQAFTLQHQQLESMSNAGSKPLMQSPSSSSNSSSSSSSSSASSSSSSSSSSSTTLLSVHQHDCNHDPNALSRTLVSALHIGCLLSSLLDSESFCPDMRRQVMDALFRLNRLKVHVRSGRTALHYACYREGTLVGRYPSCQFPSASLAKALLEVGADPNEVDDAGNTPLHLAATLEPYVEPLAHTLLEGGAHLDTKNDAGETFESLLAPTLLHKIIDPMKYTSLACLAARTIKKHGIKYEETVPAALYEFIELH